MATTTQSLLISGFTSTNSITVVHNLDRLNLNYRVVCSGTSRPDLVQSVLFVDGNERNEFTVNLVSNETGFVQVLDSDIFSINLPSPSNSLKIVDILGLGQGEFENLTVSNQCLTVSSSTVTITGSLNVSGNTLNNIGPFNQTGASVFTGSVLINGVPASTTDSYVTGATLNTESDGSKLLELGRNGGLTDVTANLSSIDGTVTSVGGTGSVNGLTLGGTVTDSGNLTLGGTLAINDGDWSGTSLSIGNGGTGQGTPQEAIDALSRVGDASNEYVLTKDTVSGKALWKAASGGTDTFVSGGTVNVDSAGVTVDFVGNSSETTFGVDMGIIQHDRQVADIPTWSPFPSPSTYTDIVGATLVTGNLGTNGDYIIIFNANWQGGARNKEVGFQILVDGSAVAISERGYYTYKDDEDYTISSSIMVENVASGTTIKVQGKISSGGLSVQRGTLIIDGIRTTNNIS